MKSNILIEDPNMDIQTSIIIAGEQLFLRYGIRSVSINDISSSLGISKHLFYTYFPDKSALLNEVCKRKIDEAFLKLKRNQHMGSALQEAEFLFEEISNFNSYFSALFFRDLELKYPYIYQLFADFKIHLIEEVFALNIQQGIIQGVYRSDTQVVMMSRLWFDLITYAYQYGYPLSIVKQHFIRGLLV
ncbi:TetR/AcrR family transcriptional regulator [Pedobacter sp. ASV28]|uniref:TetR/AcrR family transcriptional regulator n=1 Tax=Pedobacter sp. ASV28 TaxID=2795123 RepID=UPI0018EC427C|nr:TetR/AcrR family transcriptional regulator [Pedobacter sp. ASV28]